LRKSVGKGKIYLLFHFKGFIEMSKEKNKKGINMVSST